MTCIDFKAASSAAVEAQERVNVKNARWTIMHDGMLLPVTNLYDSEGNEISNPMRAYSVVAYDASRSSENWTTISGVDPGEVWSKSP